VVVALLAAGLAGCVAALAGIGIVSWRRTSALRRGIRPAPGDVRPPAGGRTSPATSLAGAAGVIVAALTLSAGAPPWLTAVGLAWAGTIAVGGFAWRVTRVEATATALRIHVAARPPFEATWDDVRTVRPPRTPLDGWRFETAVGARTLMPSDLLHHERVLAVALASSGLRFAGRRWRHDAGRAR
jgi:hypothetical protein